MVYVKRKIIDIKTKYLNSRRIQKRYYNNVLGVKINIVKSKNNAQTNSMLCRMSK